MNIGKEKKGGGKGKTILAQIHKMQNKNFNLSNNDLPLSPGCGLEIPFPTKRTRAAYGSG